MTANTAVATGRMPRVLSTLDGFAIAISNVGPTVSIGVGLGVLSSVVGAQMPIVFILAALPMLGIAASYVYLSREEPNCGTSYVWLRKAFSPWIGFLSGFVGIASSIVFLAYAAPLAGQITVSIAQSLGAPVDPGNSLLTLLVGLGWLTLVTFLAIRGTEVAARVQTVLVAIEFAIVLGLGIVAMTAGTASPVRAAWFNPGEIASPGLLVGGLVLTVYVFWGWDSAFNVSEETTTPSQAARAGIGTIIAVLGMFLFASVMFLRALTPKELVDHGALALPYLGEKLFGPLGSAVAALALQFSTIAVLQAVVIATARIALSMGRDRTLGTVWTTLHPRFGTPARGTFLIAVISAVLAIGATAVGPLQTVIVGVVSAIGILISLTYGFGGLASAWRFREMLRRDPRRSLLTVVLPFLSALALFFIGGAFAWQQAVSTDHWAFDAANGWFLLTIPVAILVLGGAVAVYARFIRKPGYFIDPNFVDITESRERQDDNTDGRQRR